MRLVATQNKIGLPILPSVHTRQVGQVQLCRCATFDENDKCGNVHAPIMSMNMNQQTPTPTPAAKTRVRKEVSNMRKLTSELDDEVRKVEVIKTKMAKLEKAISAGNDRIKVLMAQLSKNIT